MCSLVVALLLLLSRLPAAATVQLAAPSIEVNVDPTGRYEIHSPLGTFGGDVGRPLSNITSTDSQDALGAFHEVDFDYLEGSRRSGIRVYQATWIVLFSTTYVVGGANVEPFPTLGHYPSLPYKLSYRD